MTRTCNIEHQLNNTLIIWLVMQVLKAYFADSVDFDINQHINLLGFNLLIEGVAISCHSSDGKR